MTDAEYFNQRRAKPGPNVGRVAAQHNMVELIGGFARVQDRTEAQTMAAARYRNFYEAAQLGGARAVDLTAVRVHTSGPSPELMIEKGARARRQYADAVQFLGMQRSSLVERVVIHDMSLRQIEASSRARARIAQELKDALDDLADHFCLGRKRNVA